MTDMSKEEVHTVFKRLKPNELIVVKYNTIDRWGWVEFCGIIREITPYYLVVRVAYASPNLVRMSSKVIIVEKADIIWIMPLVRGCDGSCIYAELNTTPVKKKSYIRLLFPTAKEERTWMT